MTEYFVRLPEHHVGRDYQPRPAGEEFIVAMATPRHLFNIGDHVWMAQLMVGICDYVEKNLGRPVVFEFIHRQDQQDIDEILGECLVVRQDDHSSYKNKFGQLAEIGRLLYPEQIKTRCVFDRLGGDARRARFIDKESWPVVMGTGLRNAPMVAPLGGMIEAWQETMKYKHMGFETVDCANENYRAPDLIIHCNQKNQMELRHSAATVDLKYDDLPFFLRHLAPSGVEFGLLGSSVFTRDDLAARAEQMRKYNCDPNVNMVPVQPVTQLWANSVGRVLQEVAVRHGVDAPVFSLPKNIDSPPHHGSIKKLGKMTTEANINFYPLCVIQASTSMKSKNPPMHVLMQHAEEAVANGIRVIFIGAPDDAHPEYLKDNMHNWVGKTTLAESMMLLRHPATKHFISGDSGLAHYLGVNQRDDQEMTTIFLSSNPDLSRAVSPCLRVINLGSKPALRETLVPRLEA